MMVPALKLGIFLLSATVTFGCSKEDLKQVYDEAKTKTQELSKKTEELTKQSVAEVKERLPASGSINLESSPSIAPASRATIEVIKVSDDRPAVMQLASYNTELDRVAYPAILFHGLTTSTDVGSLSGTTVMCDAYVQASASDKIAMTQPGIDVRLSFGVFNAEEGTISATLSKATLAFSNDQPLLITSGRIVAAAK